MLEDKSSTNVWSTVLYWYCRQHNLLALDTWQGSKNKSREHIYMSDCCCTKTIPQTYYVIKSMNLEYKNPMLKF